MKKRGFEWIQEYQELGKELPQRSTAGSAGYDLAAVSAVTLAPQKVTLVPTGLKAYMQPNEYLGIHIRSSLAVKQQIGLANSQGIIDADYYNNPDNEGHILIALINFGEKPVEIPAGTRIAQGIFYSFLLADDDHAAKSRSGGFGSTGKK